MSELNELVQDIETFKKNVASSNEVFEKMDAAIEETKRVSDNQAKMQKEIEEKEAKTDNALKTNSEALDQINAKIDALEKQNKKMSKLLLVASCVGAALGLVALILGIILFIK